MYKIVASDMDETFLARDHSIPQANIDAIRRMRELGVMFVPASGRAYGSVLDSFANAPKDLLEGTYLISYNGGCINRVGDPTPLTSHTLPFHIVESLFHTGLQLGVGIHIYQLDGTIWAAHLSQDEKDYLAGHMPYRTLPSDSIEFLRTVPIAKMLFARADLPYLHRIANELGPVAGTSTTFSSGRYLEFNPEGVDKGAGLRKLAELLGVSMSDTIAVGDSLNDLSMIEAAGCGVAVSNATDGIELKADYRAQSSCDDGVLAEIVEKILTPCS